MRNQSSRPALKTLVLLLGAAGLAAVGQGRAAMDGGHAAMGMHKPPPSGCTDLILACAATVTPAVAPDGTLWLAARVGDRLFVARTADGGRTLSPVAIDTNGATLDWGPDARPQLAFAPDGTVALAYATFRDDRFNGEVFLTRSTDGGAHFAAPTPITDVQESQRFPQIAFDRDGHLLALWLDKRGRIAARAQGQAYPGAGLAVAQAPDAHASLGQAQLVQENTCECCRIALAFTPEGRAVALFRNIFPGGVRDHAVVTFDGLDHPGPLHRVSIDDWRTDACPHHGPSLAIATDGSYHAAWYSQGAKRQGLFYARSTDAGASWSEPMPLGPKGQALSRPHVLAVRGAVWLAWKAFDGEATRVMVMASHDAGAHWGAARAAATANGNSDHPILVDRGGQAFLSWQTDGGYRFEPLGDGS